ncbi:hypothetical protein AC579_1487 [Pseudocercospora musae]|uniref:Cytochrome c oxidase assembly protein COX20, mitochondrial n=1 Tax=Pseudocercospora musae TaxID=113226 RepID=A0A139H3A4_9PEZI|nr:hypothetical protein AC579_1487 [Pseudocercospora musae]
MADDTRQSPQREDLSKEALTVNPEKKAFSGTQWQGGKQIPYKPPENANMMAGGTLHTAGGEVPDVTIMNALQAGTPIWEVHKRPCVRDSLLQGMIGGFAVGGGRLVFGASIPKAANWAAGTFCLSAGVLYQYCMYQRQAEKEGMMRAVEILNKKQAAKQAREERKAKLREERREAKDKELDVQYKAAGDTSEGKAWYKFW